MGYRIRLGKIAKTQKALFAGKSHEQCVDLMNQNEALYRLQSHTELYEIGKYFNLDKSYLLPFYDFDIREAEESDFFILEKEGLLKIIDFYKAETAEYYRDLFQDVAKFLPDPSRHSHGDTLNIKDPDTIGRLMAMLYSKQNDWNSDLSKVVQLEPGKDGEITGSWSIEYAIFNLVHILKTFDWENDYLIYSGW
ncbi:hypothetical protein [Vibrio fluvialis]|uniref:hypothetical protein n=1 Tax=Vibrio fluvialis TaxID=676 RepID=UPI003D0BA327